MLNSKPESDIQKNIKKKFLKAKNDRSELFWLGAIHYLFFQA
jgi:hypothetical protein